MTTTATTYIVPLNKVTPEFILPPKWEKGTFFGRAMVPGVGASVVALNSHGNLIDITPFVVASSVLCNNPRMLEVLREAREHGENIGGIGEVLANTNRSDNQVPYFLAPIDFQAAVGAGVTYINSWLERVVSAHPKLPDLRAQLIAIIGGDNLVVKPGSDTAQKVMEFLESMGIDDDYTKPAFGTHAEIFDKAMSCDAVGPGHISMRTDAPKRGAPPTAVGSESELILIVNKNAKIVGYTVGNDFSAGGFENASHLYLPKAKHYDGSAGMSPLVRVPDESFTAENATSLNITLFVEGRDGFVLRAARKEGQVGLLSPGRSYSTGEISRPHTELADQALAVNRHEFGRAVYCGAGYIPTMNREDPERPTKFNEFTHRPGDTVSIIASDWLAGCVHVVTPVTEFNNFGPNTGEVIVSLLNRPNGSRLLQQLNS